MEKTIEKERVKEKSTDVKNDIQDRVTETARTSSRTSNKGMLSRLASAVMKHAKLKEVGASFGVTLTLSLLLSMFLPTTILPMLLGFGVAGAGLGGMIPDDVFSVIAGTGLAGLVGFFFFVSAPFFGLGLITAVVLGVLGSGLATAAHQTVANI